MSTGADLERAVQEGANYYQQHGRGELAKQQTPRLHIGTYARRAPIDFKGFYRIGDLFYPLYVEAKATSDGLIKFVTVGGQGDGINEGQFEAMRDAVNRDIRMLLVVDMVRESEVYVVDAKHLLTFTAAPWRKSIGLAWLRAFGEVATVVTWGRLRRVMYLDTAPHALRDVSYLACVEEKAKAGNRIVELFPSEMASPVTKGPEKLTKEQRLEGVRRAMEEGIVNAAKGRKRFGGRR